MPSLSRETLEFLAELLSQVQLHAGAPNFEEAAQRVIRVKRELAAALQDSPGKPVGSDNI